MRRYLFVLPFVVACAKSETPAADSTAAAMPAAVTEADVAGTWTGTLMMEGSDSVIAHWTDVCGGGSCRLTTQESPKDTVTSTYVIQADSVVGTAAAYADASLKGTMVTDHWVGRITGNQVTGSGMLKLASNPDSVVMRYRFTGTKNP
jgi:hypothetical protein